MEPFQNYYEILGLTRAATEMEIAQAHQALVQKLQSAPGAVNAAQVASQLARLEEARQTLLYPPSRKKHDEDIAWLATKRDLEADKARQLAWRLKEEQAAAQEAEKAALEAAKTAAVAAARKAAEDAKRQKELDRVEAEAAARFRQLREEQDHKQAEKAALNGFADTLPAPEEPLAAQAQPSSAGMHSVAVKSIVGSLVFVVFFFMTYIVVKPDSPPTPPRPVPATLPIALPTQPAASAARPPAVPPVGTPMQDANPVPDPSKPTNSSKTDSAKAEEARLYQKTLQRVEREHPELNPKLPAHRADLIAFVAARVNVHVKAGYSKSKALEIAVRDLETQEQTQRLIDKLKAEKAQAKPLPEVPSVADPGGHSGFDPKCRWVTPEQWSCK